MRLLNIAVVLVVLMALLGSCKQRKLASPPHYKFAEAYIDKLDPKLKEISGLAWDSKNNIFLAIEDEKGTLFSLGRDNRVIVGENNFGAPGDYEDVALYNGIPYILRSDGMLVRYEKDSTGKGRGVEIGMIPIGGPNDFETLYADMGKKALILICKTCKVDDGNTISAFAYYPDSIGFDTKPVYTINVDSVAKLSPFKSSRFEPSAAAIHPVLHKLFILSSTSHQLAITDSNGKVESVYKMATKIFPQPEGLAFKQNGDMFVTNEGGMGRPTICIFSFYKDADSTTTPPPAGFPYNFAAPDEIMKLGNHLHEISGMAYIPATGMILTENDEKGDIFTIDFKNKLDKVGKIKFGGKGDYEDIVYTDSAVYMLISSGTIVKVNMKDSSMITQDFVLDNGGKKNEFEAMYLDKANHSLVLLCKECSHEKDQVRNAYRFDYTSNSFSPEPLYTIKISDIQHMIKDDKAVFKPSAAGIDPVTGKLFIVASVGKLLVVAGRDGKVENVFRLDPKMYNQPEGLTFAPNGDLYISNEGGEGIATILKFSYRK